MDSGRARAGGTAKPSTGVETSALDGEEREDRAARGRGASDAAGARASPRRRDQEGFNPSGAQVISIAFALSLLIHLSLLPLGRLWSPAEEPRHEEESSVGVVLVPVTPSPRPASRRSPPAPPAPTVSPAPSASAASAAPPASTAPAASSAPARLPALEESASPPALEEGARLAALSHRRLPSGRPEARVTESPSVEAEISNPSGEEPEALEANPGREDVHLELPEARAVARRQVVQEMPESGSDAERIEARVTKMMRESLPPRLQDESPMPPLHPDGQGNLVYENGAFRAKIMPDGTVSFSRRRGAKVEFVGRYESPDPEEQDILNQAERIPGVPMVVEKANAADCARGECRDRAGPGVRIRFFSDLNDLAYRAHGDDPLAAKKRRFLRLTRKLREDLAAKAERRRVRFAKLRAGRHLKRLWADRSLSYAAKRRRLFELWDECDEARGEDDDRAGALAGERARRAILAFIRAKLPRGSPIAYTAEELRAFNASRRSRQPFAPYVGQ